MSEKINTKVNRDTQKLRPRSSAEAQKKEKGKKNLIFGQNYPKLKISVIIYFIFLKVKKVSKMVSILLISGKVFALRPKKCFVTFCFFRSWTLPERMQHPEHLNDKHGVLLKEKLSLKSTVSIPYINNQHLTQS